MIRLVLRAWLVGAAVYLLALRFGHRAPLGGAILPVMVVATITALVLIPLLYLPALRALHRRLGSTRPRSAFLALGIGLGIVPFCISTLALTRSAGALLSADALMLFYLFAAMGAVLGLGWAPAQRS